MNSLIELLEEHEVDFKRGLEHPHVREGWIGVDCPWCGEGSKKYHLGINIEGNYSVCWRCGYHDLPAVLSRLTRQTVSQKTLDRMQVGRQFAEHPQIRPVRLPAGRSALSPVHRRYLEGRGLDASLAASRWGLEGISIHAVLGWRIFIPIHLHGKIVSWTTRAIGENQTRYLSANPERDGGLPLKHLLYGADFARHAVVIVEGPADAWKIGPGAVATFGIAYSQEQVALLAKYPIRVVCFDAEEQAVKAGGKLCEALHLFSGETYQVILDSGDPGDAPEKMIQWIRKTYLEG